MPTQSRRQQNDLFRIMQKFC